MRLHCTLKGAIIFQKSPHRVHLEKVRGEIMNISERSLRQIHNWMNLVKNLRKQHRLSQKEMAQLLGIGVGSLRKIENDSIPLRMSVDVVFKVHAVFGILPEDQFKDIWTVLPQTVGVPAYGL